MWKKMSKWKQYKMFKDQRDRVKAGDYYGFGEKMKRLYEK